MDNYRKVGQNNIYTENYAVNETPQLSYSFAVCPNCGSRDIRPECLIPQHAKKSCNYMCKGIANNVCNNCEWKAIPTEQNPSYNLSMDSLISGAVRK